MKHMLAIVFAFMLQSTALAHDASSLNIIGFSDDSKLFAYEEYSAKDIDTYAIIHVVDTTTGKEVAGAPVGVDINPNDEEEKRASMSLQAVRREAWEKAKSLLNGFNVPNHPAILFAAAPIAQQISDKEETDKDQVFRFCMFLLCSHGSEAEVRLKTHKVKPHEYCSEPDPKGFRLIATSYHGGDQNEQKVIWNSTLGQSEACVYQYHLEQVVGNEDGLFVAMIAYWFPFLEGPHRRYLAVPLKLD